MEGETSLEGQGFTLVIFVCVVVLSSVFFILGMLAGRSQVAATEVPAEAQESIPLIGDADLSEDSGDPDLTFYESVAETELPGLDAESGSESADALPPPEPATRAPEPAGLPSAPEVAVMLQVGAFANAGPARELSEQLVEQGFPAFVLRPGPDDTPPLNRVRVGPFSDSAEVERVRAALEADGHKPIVVE